MNIMLKLPQEWEKEFKKDRFADFFGRVIADLNCDEARTLVGNYEFETLSMLREAFANVEVMNENSTDISADGDPVVGEMKKVDVFCHPFCDTHGTIKVPTEIVDAGKMSVVDYINEHFDDIKFGEPDLNYRGTDYDIEDDINGYYNASDEKEY